MYTHVFVCMFGHFGKIYQKTLYQIVVPVLYIWIHRKRVKKKHISFAWYWLDANVPLGFIYIFFVWFSVLRTSFYRKYCRSTLVPNEYSNACIGCIENNNNSNKLYQKQIAPIDFEPIAFKKNLLAIFISFLFLFVHSRVMDETIKIQ